ncbi:hypothetical protein FVEG_15191 [Fusarium verticillioides 7600]|uniref:Uncharacterized protein n=1 Tax=Gibberella moniliformis (strain M3125 / FGSC 7600) TaxID=334819 RepID=W7M064_GIBM7|nr:hypothetical protein FVEG_15191 [Fusarium verticillioides 7600]EWG40889.1 hypothetical protein FVEG_15191 [Fusarium verticillioides 7600]RBQ79139.1 hypothetical protein FVER14953_21316 [Fusarium verticillioides]
MSSSDSTTTNTPGNNTPTTSTPDVIEVPRSDLVTVKDTDYDTDKYVILCGKCGGVLNVAKYSCMCEHGSDAARAA